MSGRNPESYLPGGAGVVPTLLVASSEATAKEKAAADYVCTGTADNATIAAAIAALPTVTLTLPSGTAPGGRVQLTGGRFRVDAPIGNLPKGAELVGVGPATVLDISHFNSGVSPVLTMVGSLVSNQQSTACRLADLSFRGVAVLATVGVVHIQLGSCLVERVDFFDLDNTTEAYICLTKVSTNRSLYTRIRNCNFDSTPPNGPWAVHVQLNAGVYSLFTDLNWSGGGGVWDEGSENEMRGIRNIGGTGGALPTVRIDGSSGARPAGLLSIVRDCFIEGSNSVSGPPGIHLLDAVFCLVEGCVTSTCSGGIKIEGGDSNKVTSHFSSAHDNIGIWLTGSTAHNDIQNVTAWTAVTAGVQIDSGCLDNAVRNCDTRTSAATIVDNGTTSILAGNI